MSKEKEEKIKKLGKELIEIQVSRSLGVLLPEDVERVQEIRKELAELELS